MRKYLFFAAMSLLGVAAGTSVASHLALQAAARADQQAAIQRVQADNAAMRVELDALRRELARRPVPPPNGPVAPNADLIPATSLPTAPKE